MTWSQDFRMFSCVVWLRPIQGSLHERRPQRAGLYGLTSERTSVSGGFYDRAVSAAPGRRDGSLGDGRTRGPARYTAESAPTARHHRR